jgi:hypothetical protein
VISASAEDVRDLLHACADSSDFRAWEQFVARFERAITLSVIRTARQWGEAPDEIAADLVQETYLRLCDGRFHLLSKFALNHPHAVDGYVKTVAARSTTAMSRRRPSRALAESSRSSVQSFSAKSSGGSRSAPAARCEGAIKPCSGFTTGTG